MRFVVALILLFVVTPGMTEVAESVAHAVGHGDLPHHEDDGAGLGCDEHTCTPLFHACGCHAPMSAQTVVASSASHPDLDAMAPVILSASSDAGRVGEPPPLRPPIG
ncbi:MAG: hypothetical protein F9K40_03220 [Kofleriaceae bacterium]|nr:MAG: hypothetical protein F9K40_03220 [Kofleriaceae bacterium]MBZ0233075.1 hypothetical protein [Kofleriaceae bacterium]